MEDSEIALLAAVATALIFLFTFLVGPLLAPSLPYDLVKSNLFSFFDIPASLANAYNLSNGSIGFYATWGFLASMIALVVDVMMFLGLRADIEVKHRVRSRIHKGLHA